MMMRNRAAGQVTIEYFLLFAAVILITLIGLTTVDNDLAGTFETLFSTAASKIVGEETFLPADGGGNGNGGGGGGGGGGGLILE